MDVLLAAGLIIRLLLLLVPSAGASCSKFWTHTIFITKGNSDKGDKVKVNISNTAVISNNTVVKVTCIDSNKRLDGPDIVICINGAWDAKPPICVDYKHEDPLPWTIIGSSIGGGVFVIVIVTVVLVILIRKRSNRKRYESRNRIGKMDISVPFRDVRNSDLSDNHINTRQTDSVFYHQSHHGHLQAGNNRDDMRVRQDSRYASAGSIHMSRNIDGISLIGSSASVLGISNIPIFKVWTCRRTRRKFIRAENLANLKKKAAAVYEYDNPVRFALEEDGTEVEDDEILASCAGKTLIVLSGHEHWTDPFGTSDHVKSQRFTFDVCSYDRTVRKLILAENLKDLAHQAPAYFGYSVRVVCLEIDGTCIEDDETLVSMSTQTMMMLGKDHIWTATSDDIPPLQNIEQPEVERLSNTAFKVWSDDFSKKKIIKADNCIDLHIKAAQALKLEMPIQIRVKDESTIISTDKVLQANTGKTLIAVEQNAPQWVQKNIDNSQQEYKNNQGRHSDEINGPSSSQHSQTAGIISMNDTGKQDPNRGGRLNNNIEESRLHMSNGSNRNSTENIQRPTQQFNHPDIVKSSELAGIPSRYAPSTQLHSDSSEFRKPDSDSKTQQKAAYNEGTPDYHNIVRLDESQQAERLTNASVMDNARDLPYGDLTPSHQLNLGNSSQSRQSVPEPINYDLPYSNLQPSHKKDREKNKYDVIRPEGNKKILHSTEDDNFVLHHNKTKPPLQRQSSFLVTGGAKQSNHSDVLF